MKQEAMMKKATEYVILGTVCIAFAGIGSFAAQRATFKQEVTTNSVYASKHAWPDLSSEQKAALIEELKKLPKDTKADIVCNDAGCSDLAADIDDAFEAAGFNSSIDRAIGPLGYGIGVQVNSEDRPAAETIIRSLNRVSATKQDIEIVNGASAKGYVTIIIGKHPKS